MRTGAAAGHTGYYHETAFYGSDDEFVDIVRPFLLEGLEAGEPTIVACGDHNTSLLERSVGRSGIRYLTGGDQYARPGPTIAAYRRLFSSLVADGAAQIRVIGDVPHPGTGASWEGWLRYEAAVNVAYDDFPLWGMCPYDTRTTPADVLEDVVCTHPNLATAEGRHNHNTGFLDPHSYLKDRGFERPALLDTDPGLVLEDPTSRVARRAVQQFAQGHLSAEGIDDLCIVVSELVDNARRHGREPVMVTAWDSTDGVTVSVSDAGDGPSDPLAGWMPPPVTGSGGRGLWIANQLSDLQLLSGPRFEAVATVRRSWAE